jgi:hypothetical protein
MVEQHRAARPSTQARSLRHKRRRARTTAAGAAILLLAVVGVGTLLFLAGRQAVGYVRDYLGPTENADFFEQYIEPVVVEDPKPFSDVTKVGSEWTLTTAIWACLSADENSGHFGYTADNREILPIADLKKSFEKYFGDAVKPAYHTFQSGSSTFEYDEKNQCYYIPVFAINNVYIPKVSKISRSGHTVTLTVEYIPGSGWSQDKNGRVIQPGPAKTMLYVLQGGRGSYFIRSILQGAAPVSSSAAGSSAAGAAGSSSASSGG